MNDIWVAPRFQRQVDKHIFMNDWYHHRRWPLMLIIHGPKGVGKSTQIRAALSALKVECFDLSAGKLAGDERVASDELSAVYERASRHISTKSPAAIVIDDLDLSILSRKDHTSYSQNTQLLTVTLMSLCDNPRKFFGVNVFRVPIIATANEMSGFHAPLVRSGRAQIWNWVPSEQERLAIVATKFPFLTTSEQGRLDREFSRDHGFGLLDEIAHEAIFGIFEDNPALRELEHTEALNIADEMLKTMKLRHFLEIGKTLLAERSTYSHLR
ncbi:MAG: hypothetical protein A4S17_05490 [Proteobacteria bacterium HN_bin10]|nr:MAG: hypothetical protein A4S17_05490 [Proteobacteria bacterium HN_bin10]